MYGEKIRKYLDENDVHYEIIDHRVEYTAQRVAESIHIHGQEVAKTVIIKVDGELHMAVVSSSQMVDISFLQKIFGTKEIVLADEKDFEDIFPDCEVGAMPPFGNLYKMKMFISEKLSTQQEFVFNAGSHGNLIKIRYYDYERLIHPMIVNFKK